MSLPSSLLLVLVFTLILAFYVDIVPVLSVAMVTSTTISLNWTPSDSSVNRYTISHTHTIKECGLDTVGPESSISDGNARNFTLTHLEEDSDYTITLTAHGTRGQIDYNTVSSATADTGNVRSIWYEHMQ